MRRRQGFTLLEVIIALAILGVSLTAIFRISSQAVYAQVYAKKLTVATLLARSKMTDLEQELYDKGFQVDDDEQSGDFSDDGWSNYKWRAKVLAPKMNGLSPDQLMSAVFNLPTGGGDGKDGKGGGGLGGLGALAGMFGGGATPPGGSPTGGPAPDPKAGILGALGPMAGLAQAQFQQMTDTLQKSVREVHLTVSWKEGKLTESIDLVTHVVSMGPGGDRNGGAAAAAGQASGGGGFVRADNGMPVPNAVAGPNGTMVDPSDNTLVVPSGQFGQGPLVNPATVGKQFAPSGLGNIVPPMMQGNRLPIRPGFPQ